MALPFVGPSYETFGGQASRSRSVNLYLSAMESPAKAAFVLQSVPGLIERADAAAVVRGCIDAGGRAFFVAGSKLYELSAAWGLQERGTLLTSAGQVGMAWGLTQLVMVDGAYGYVLRLSSDVFERITDTDWPGASSVGYLNGFFTFVVPNGQQAYVSAIDDATDIDALDYVSAERVPDDLVSQVVLSGEQWLLGSLSAEVWSASGATSADYPLQRNNGANSDVGCLAAGSVQALDNGFMMLGRDRNGSGLVFRANGLQLQRASTQAVEQALRQSTDLSQAVAWVYQQDGLTHYCLNAPGLTSTWCYEVSTGQWYERCDLDGNGQLTAGRVTHAMFAHKRVVAFDADGKVYEQSSEAYTNAGDPLVRMRVSPNDVVPSRDRVFYSEFAADVTTGTAAQAEEFYAELGYSNDGGNTWGTWLPRSTGKVGQFFQRLFWTRLGHARDRVWRLRYSGNTPFTIVSGEPR